MKVILLGVGVGRVNEDTTLFPGQDMHICYNFLPIFTDFQCSVSLEFQSANLTFPENRKG